MTNTVEVVNNSLNDVLARGLEATGGYIEKATNFAIEQAPDVVNQYLQWEFWSNVGLASFFFVILCVSLFFCVKWWTICNRGYWNDSVSGSHIMTSGSHIFGAIVSLLLSGILLCVIPTKIYAAAKVKIAPKVLIIEKFSKTIR